MSDEESSKALLEKLCRLQEEHLALLRQSLQDRERFVEREEKLQQAWERQLSHYEQSQKAYEEREIRHEKRAVVRGALVLVMLGLIVAAIIVARFL